jgi:peptide/nickel transport system ATP-binding protein
MSEPRLAIESLSAISARDGNKPVLRAVSLGVGVGEVRGLVGESGAGKSTIAKAILGIIPAQVKVTGGRIAFEGRDLLTLPPRELREILGRDIALIPQDPLTALNPARRIEPQMTDGLRLKGNLLKSEARRRALALLEEVQIRDPERVLASYPHQLSGGMRQRVLIAAAFGLEPKLVIADEPTTALDVTVQKQILRLLRALQERHGTSVLFVSHDLGVVAKICDRITVLYMGKVVEEGAAAAVIEAPRHAYTKALIAASPRYDRPDAGLEPTPPAVIAALRAEIAAADALALQTPPPLAGEGRVGASGG